MGPNLLVLVGASFIPFLLAYIWFHPAVFGGDKWTQIAGMSAEKGATPVKPVKLLLSIVLNFLIAFGLFSFTVHQFSIIGLLGGNTELLKTGTAAAFLAEYGSNHLSFGHGAVHGFLATVTFALPMLGYVVIFEKKSAKYFWVYLGYWFLSLVLMSGVICQWGAQSAV